MYEPHQILGAILFGALGIYLIVFYGSAIIAWVYGSYLHDGDKEVWSLPAQMKNSKIFCDDNSLIYIYAINGIGIPFTLAVIAFYLLLLTKCTGMLVPYILMGIASTWAILYVLRAVIRLNKKLDKHASDKDAHKKA